MENAETVPQDAEDKVQTLGTLFRAAVAVGLGFGTSDRRRACECSPPTPAPTYRGLGHNQTRRMSWRQIAERVVSGPCEDIRPKPDSVELRNPMQQTGRDGGRQGRS